MSSSRNCANNCKWQLLKPVVNCYTVSVQRPDSLQFNSRSLKELWNLAQTSVWFGLARNTCNNFEKSPKKTFTKIALIKAWFRVSQLSTSKKSLRLIVGAFTTISKCVTNTCYTIYNFEKSCANFRLVWFDLGLMIIKHRKNCECCPGHYVIVDH